MLPYGYDLYNQGFVVDIMKEKLLMMVKAVFLDRDGVLTEERNYVKTADEMRIYEYSKSCINKLHDFGFLAIVITNQSGIARGYFTEDDLKLMNRKLQLETGVDDIFYCPHYSKGIVKKYSVECNCRKPKTGMIERACSEYDINANSSFLVGDRKSDISAGKNMGMKTILVRTGYGRSNGEECHPDYICNDLRDAVEICIKQQH